jgi:hypothetical protein
MQFKVPQFLEIEDKIFGPFTFKEFVYLAGGAGACFVLYKLLGFFWGVIPILVVGGLSLALALYRPNDKPFIEMFGAGILYLIQDKLYIWKKQSKDVTKVQKLTQVPLKDLSLESDLENKGGLSGGKLKDLAWSLDILDLNK